MKFKVCPVRGKLGDRCYASQGGVSSTPDIRNVPILTTLEMSPFGSAWFLCERKQRTIRVARAWELLLANEMYGSVNVPAAADAVGKWECRGVCGISKRCGKVGFLTFPARVFSTDRRAAIFSAVCHPRDLFRHRPQNGHFMCALNRTWPGSTTLAVSLVCSRGASCDNPAARGDPLWEWAAFVSWPWPPRVLRPELGPW